MKFNKDTIVCISKAEKPGDFGVKFHNSLYRIFGMNWVYLPRKVSKDINLEDIKIEDLEEIYPKASKLYQQKAALNSGVEINYVGEYCKKLTQQNIF